jgi:hypothetical protein
MLPEHLIHLHQQLAQHGLPVTAEVVVAHPGMHDLQAQHSAHAMLLAQHEAQHAEHHGHAQVAQHEQQMAAMAAAAAAAAAEHAGIHMQQQAGDGGQGGPL